MSIDHQQSYKRATNVSLLGMGLQLLLGLVLLIYSLYGHDVIAMSASMFVLIGVLAWLTLAIVYDQQRRERLESAEAEMLSATDAASSSAFDAAGDEIRVAAKRLRMMQRFFVPAVSVLIAGLLIGTGLLRFGSAQELVSGDDLSKIMPASRGWAIALGLGMGVIGFVFARFVSGMAKQAVWANLRGGAVFAVGSSLLGLSIALVHFVDIVGPDGPLRYLVVVVPIFQIVIGIEVLLNLVLDAYRPRKAGHLPRPAFDSRLLGFIAAPDKIAESISEAINYQFGFNVTSSWFYQFMSKWVSMFVLAGGLVIWSLTSLAVVQPHQRAIITRFGKVVRGQDESLKPGLNLKWPWPIERLEIPKYTYQKTIAVDLKLNRKKIRNITTHTVTGIRTIELGTLPPANKGPILWTNEHATEERYQLVQPSALVSDLQIEDLALVSIEMPLHYVISDVYQYESFATSDQREELLKGVAQRVMISYLATKSVDDLLGTGRLEVAKVLRRRIQEAFDKLEAGVEVQFAGIEGVHPPRDAAPSFERVVEATQNREGKIEQARENMVRTLSRVVGSVELAQQVIRELDELEKYKSMGDTGKIAEQENKLRRLLEQAGGSAASLIHEARAQRWAKHMGARGRASRYQGQVQAYNASPLLYKATLFFETLKEALADARVYVTSPDGPRLWINTDLQDRDTGTSVFREQNEDDF